jgi:hypothetical protein
MIAVDQLSHTDGPVSCEVGTVGMGRWRITEEEVDTKAWRALMQPGKEFNATGRVLQPPKGSDWKP